jgi:acyl-CoA reductase-like NAD-dependent aldehyde dehydrogenase
MTLGNPLELREDSPMLTPETRAELEAALADLAENKERWARLDLDQHITILEEITRDLRDVAPRWIGASLEAKGLAPGSYGEGEEWVVLAVVFRLVRLLRASLEQIRASGRPGLPGAIHARPDGQTVARVFPLALWERLFLAGMEAEAWLEPGVRVEEVAASQARSCRERGPGGVALVLGAGNVSALAPADLLHKLFVEGRVVLLKPNPVNAYLAPLYERGFRALIRRGFLRVVSGGAAEGAFLCGHPLVDELHMTGSDRTYEAIVFGPGTEGARRRAEDRPLVDKPFSAELGNISPVIVVPGPWSDDDVAAQGGRIASWMVNNAGFNCLTPRVLVQHDGWGRRRALRRAVRRALGAAPPRRAYYPGARARHAAFLDAHPDARMIGSPAEGELPWTLIEEVDPTRTDDICFRTEAFCALTAETGIPGSSVAEFIERAVDFANETLWGTLTASILVHPKSLGDRQVARAVDRAVARLRYGTVVINNYGGMAYYLGVAPWGAFPGHHRRDIQSGTGFVQNALMLDRVQKSVVRCPFRPRPDPSALTSRRFHEFGRALALYEADPSVLGVPGVLASVLRS